MEEQFIESPENDDNDGETSFPKNTFSHVRNKTRRNQIYKQMKQQKAKQKKAEKLRKKAEEKELGYKPEPKQLPKTIESMRIFDETMVDPEDREVQHEESLDEMASYYKRDYTPKVLLTHSSKAFWRIWRFLKELSSCIPNSAVFRRKNIPLKRVIRQAKARDYTDVIVLHHDKKVPNGFIISHLPDGPTAHFRISNLRIRKELRKLGGMSEHKPEVILNNFNTRLGHRVGRLLASLFDQDPHFVGRRAVTFHNQRDFIFFRHHRYIFRNNGKVGLQELGPRFTLKLRSLQKGTFDTKFGEYEYIHKRREVETSRRKFML